MSKKIIFGLLIFLILLYPAISVFQLNQTINDQVSAEIMEQQLSAYQLSIWFTWLFSVIVSVYYKWTTGRNDFFLLYLWSPFRGIWIFWILFPKIHQHLWNRNFFPGQLYAWGVCSFTKHGGSGCINRFFTGRCVVVYQKVAQEIENL